MRKRKYDDTEGLLAVSFLYPSKHNYYELQSAKAITEYFSVDHKTVDLTPIFVHMSSNLLSSGGPIPEGYYTEDSMKQTVVPGRNTIFLAVLLGIAQTEGADQIAIAAHAGDHTIYPDCRLGFLQAIARAISLASEEKVRLIYPFVSKTKADILKIGYSVDSNFPYLLTRTCYKDQEKACGVCGACVERLEAFATIGREDPIHYE
jgi:7-cyano-7-deazaguanine synthase